MSRRPAIALLDLGDQRLEYALWPGAEGTPHLVLLHEGLGSLGLWRDFPAKLAAATGCPVLAYSRRGYGGSDPVAPPRATDYLEMEALDVLPRVLAALGISRVIPVGHSDGGTIALLYAAGGARRAGQDCQGLVAMAPHVFVEETALAGIRRARQAFASGNLRRSLERHHGANTQGAFDGWAETWLQPAFRSWNVEHYLPRITAPALLIQGEGDEYGTLAQLDAITRQSGGPCREVVLPRCGHIPQRDCEEEVLAAITRFVEEVAFG